jgi:hypothetical protein
MSWVIKNFIASGACDDHPPTTDWRWTHVWMPLESDWKIEVSAG